MKTNAISVANHFIDLANKEKKALRQLGLMKRVYITHGFCLALFNTSILDERFDKVEAWKNGPVIPSVYHSFKHNQNNPIREKSVFMNMSQEENSMDFIVPELQDEMVQMVVESVWKRYEDYDDFELVGLTHKNGTPWQLCYVEGENRAIPDSYTKTYYKKFITE